MGIYEPQCLMAHFRRVGSRHNESAHSCPWRAETRPDLSGRVQEHAHLPLQCWLKFRQEVGNLIFTAASWKKISLREMDVSPKLSPPPPLGVRAHSNRNRHLYVSWWDIMIHFLSLKVTGRLYLLFKWAKGLFFFFKCHSPTYMHKKHPERSR